MFIRHLGSLLGAAALGAALLTGQDFPEKQLIEMARTQGDSPAFAGKLRATFSAGELQDGSAVVSYLGDFLWAIESKKEPFLYIDDQPVPKMHRLPGGDLWIHTASLLAGTSHAHYYRIAGKIHGNRIDTPAFTQDSDPQPGVPQGKVSEPFVHQSKIYRGWKVSWWVYASPGVDPQRRSAVMVWQDGHRFAVRGKRARLFTVTENLVHQGKIPPLVHVLIAPAQIGEMVDSPYVPQGTAGMRSLLYDTFNDDYARMVVEEIFPKVEKIYALRQDAYSRGLAGQSSGGICSLNAAWFHPQWFSRVLSRIGSYTSIQWRYGQPNPTGMFGFEDTAGQLDGGNIYPFLVRKREKRNIRIWLEDGSYDLENEHGSWTLQNIQLANSLKMKEYDFHFSFGNAQHNTHHGDAELPRALTWLWRGYDPSRSEQIYEMDPQEKDKPYFRVKIMNR